MATNPAAPAAPTNFTLDEWLAFAATNNLDDARIYDFLSEPLPPGTVTRWLARIDRITNAVKPSGVTAAKWRGRKNQIKGRAFEQMLAAVLRSVRFFSSWENVGTTTNEIDLLVQVGIGCQVSPVLRQWGSHFICECKLVNKGVNATWIGKLNTVLELHHSEVGVLVSAKGRPQGKVKTQMHILSIKSPPRIIISVNLDDLVECENGQNFLRLISTRFIETVSGAAGLITQ